MKTKWFLEADFLQACNCDFGCPCEFSAPPTQGYCEGMVAYRITRGEYGDVPLDGLGIALAVYWPKAIHEGNGTAVPFIDVKANAQQRDAIGQIISGQAGGLPFEILVQTFSKILDPQFVPINFRIDGRNSSVTVGDGAMKVVVEPIKNPVTGEPENVRIQHSTGFIFKEADCVAAKESTVNAGPVKFSWPHKAAFVAKISYSN
jgi:hypothetical protein